MHTSNKGLSGYMSKLFQALLAVLLLAPTTVSAQKIAIREEAKTVGLNEKMPLDPKITVGRLDNGLRYWIRENKRPEYRAELRLVVNVGSILEDDDQLGLAHFLEHMAFNGTENFEKMEIVNFLESIGMQFGADVNAYTSFDETVYQLTIPTDDPEIIEKSFQIMEDWAHGISLDPEEVDKERGVVIEEWRSGRGASARVFDKQLPVIFKDSRYADRLPIGTTEVLQNFTYETLERFYKDWYRPELMAVIAVGDFDSENIEEIIQEHFNRIQTVANPRPRTMYSVPGHEETLFAIGTDKEITNSSVSVLYKQDLQEQGSVGVYRQGIIEGIYDSMLNQRLAELTQQADPPFIGASGGQASLIRTKGAYMLGAGVKNEEVERGLEALLTEAERVSRFGFTATELEREKVSFLRAFERAYAERDKSNSASFAAEFTRAFLEGESTPGIEYEYELYKRFVPEIQISEVNRLARELITPQNRVIVFTGPDKAGIKTPAEQELLTVFDRVKAGEITPYEDTVSDDALVQNMPTPVSVTEEKEHAEVGITEWTLANGIKVYLKKTEFQDDQILFRGFSPGGISLASDEDYVAAVTASQVIASGGLGSFNIMDLQKKLTGKAAGVRPGISATQESLSGSASPKDIETLFQLVYLTFTAPRADQAVFSSLKSRLQAVLRNQGANPNAVFSDTLSSTLAQYHPRRKPITAELVEEMDLDKSFEFYKDRFADAGDFAFALVGNIDKDVLKPLVETYIGGLPVINREETWKDEGVRYPKGVIEKVVKKGIEPKSQTVVVFSGDLEYTRQDAYTMRSMTEVLEIKLRERLREDLGGTYSVGVGNSASRIPNEEYSVTINFGSDPDRAEELVKAVFDEIEMLKTNGVSEEDLNKVKETQRRSRETSLKQNGYWLSAIAQLHNEKRDFKDILNYEELIDALTAEMVQQAAIKYLNTENYVKAVLLPEDKR